MPCTECFGWLRDASKENNNWISINGRSGSGNYHVEFPDLVMVCVCVFDYSCWSVPCSPFFCIFFSNQTAQTENSEPLLSGSACPFHGDPFPVGFASKQLKGKRRGAHLPLPFGSDPWKKYYMSSSDRFSFKPTGKNKKTKQVLAQRLLGLSMEDPTPPLDTPEVFGTRSQNLAV